VNKHLVDQTFVEEKIEWFVSATESERHYLRLLTTHVTGATCYKDIRTYKNIIYETFQKACIAHGILGDDNEWNL
jgi:hypothetical protein